MAPFKQGQRILTEIEKCEAKGGSDPVQEVTVVFRVPSDVAGETFDQPHDVILDELSLLLRPCKLQGALPKAAQGPYRVRVHQYASDPSEQQAHLELPPEILDDVMLDKTITVYYQGKADGEKDYLVKGKLSLPWRDREHAGMVDSWSGKRVWCSLELVQIEAEEVAGAEEPAEEAVAES